MDSCNNLYTYQVYDALVRASQSNADLECRWQWCYYQAASIVHSVAVNFHSLNSSSHNLTFDLLKLINPLHYLCALDMAGFGVIG